MLLFLSLISFAFAIPEKVYLTFDDGPHKKYTVQILDILKENDIKATFFLIGNNINRNENLVNKIVEAGHIIGGHSMDHKNLTKIKNKEAKNQIYKNMQIINKYQKSLLFRFPYGADNSLLNVFLKEFGYKNIKLDIDSLDWKYKNEDRISDRVCYQLIKTKKKSVIVLMHSLKKESINALKKIILFIKSNGIKTSTLPI